jgi:hypothetical protein
LNDRTRELLQACDDLHTELELAIRYLPGGGGIVAVKIARRLADLLRAIVRECEAP